MGDRCYMQLTCRTGDAEKLAEFFAEEIERDNITVTLADQEVNYGLEISFHDSGRLPKDVPYYGYHGEGGQYGAHEFACDGKTFMAIQSSHDNGEGYVIPFDHETGEPSQAALADVKTFIQLLNRVTKLVHEKPVEAVTSNQ